MDINITLIDIIRDLDFLIVGLLTLFGVWIGSRLSAKKQHENWIIEKRFELFDEFYAKVLDYAKLEAPGCKDFRDLIKKSSPLGTLIKRVMQSINTKDRKKFEEHASGFITEINLSTQFQKEYDPEDIIRKDKMADSYQHDKQANYHFEQIRKIFEKNLKSPKWH